MKEPWSRRESRKHALLAVGGFVVSGFIVIALMQYLNTPREFAVDQPAHNPTWDSSTSNQRPEAAETEGTRDDRSVGREAVPTAAGDETWRWILACVTAEGVPVTGLQLDVIGVVNGHAKQTLRCAIDDQGIAEFWMPSGVSSLTVSAKSPEWFAAKELTIGDFEAQPDRREYRGTLVLLAKCEVYFDVRYADNAGYDGTLTVFQVGFTVDVPIVQGRGAPAKVLRREATFSAQTQRPGYQTLIQKVSEQDIAPGRRIELVLAASERPLGGLIVHVEGVSDALAHVGLDVIRMKEQRAIRRGKLIPGKPATFVYRSMEVVPGSYEAVARCGPEAARAAAVVVAGETTELRLRLAPAGAVKVRISDSEGRRIKGAVVRYPFGGYPVFPVRSSYNQEHAISDAEGVAVLKGVPPNEQKLIVEADGYEMVELRAAPLANATVELDAVMVPATGEIVVELQNAIEGAVYRVRYGHPSQSPFAESQAVGGQAELVIPRLSRRAYKVFVMGTRGSAKYLPQADVDLKQTDGRARIVLDVSGILPN